MLTQGELIKGAYKAYRLRHAHLVYPTYLRERRHPLCLCGFHRAWAVFVTCDACSLTLRSKPGI